MDFYLVVIGTLLAAICMWKIIAVAKKYKTNIALYHQKKIQPIGKYHPIWGHLYLFSGFDEVIDLCSKVAGQTKARIVSYWIMGFFPVLSVCHSATAKVVLKSSEPKPKQPGGGYNTLMGWLGDGLLLSEGKKWERNRRLLTPAFHFDVLKPYVSIYNKVFDIFLDKLEKATSSGSSVEIYNLVSLATLDTMLRCSVSYDGKIQQQGSNHPYVEAVRTLGHLSQKRVMSPWYWLDFIYYISPSGREYSKYASYVHDFDEKVIRERKKLLTADPSVLKKRHLDFLDILLTAKDEQGIGLTDREIRDEVDTFLFEGHDTTASAISWQIYMLAKHPEEQQKVYDEVKRVLGDRQDVEWSDIQEFTRMSLFIKESLRMYSPVPGIARVTTRDMDLDGVKIPINTEVNILIHVLNHLEESWTKPEEFRPDRFAEDSVRDPYGYVPFSAGPRNCIGQHFALDEQKVALAKLVQRFRVLPDLNNVPIPNKEVVTRAKNGIYIKLEKR
ncbi:cytochrome P450 4A2-like [Mizuhopecten yessoensis]|uniref:cytochrome P450 4A2-like n=1 Tax=Mizuhopecten yessoensis TaxID=6573 RepID=UPI000B4580CE|nr:cytochrome P450 4A2-like [Mizuhopecten yessoensis]